MRTAMITTAAVYFFATSCVAIEPAETVEETSVRRRREESDTEIITPENVTAVAVRFVRDYVTDAICSYSPDFCDKHQLRKSEKILMVVDLTLNEHLAHPPTTIRKLHALLRRLKINFNNDILR